MAVPGEMPNKRSMPAWLSESVALPLPYAVDWVVG